ncbi:MAG: hypothetical protein RIR33_1306 [Pseudomonadota bacterium]
MSFFVKNWVYPLPIAWGLVAVMVAEQADCPIIAGLAAASALILLAMAVWGGTHRTPLLTQPRQQ